MMRVLWITCEPLGNAARLLNGSDTQSGTWIDATADQLLDRSEPVELAVATIYHQSKMMIDPKSKTIYYGVGGVRQLRGKRDRKSAKAQWAAVIDAFKPDIIQIWGTEFSNGLDVAEAAHGIPLVIYIQGVMRAIAKYRYGNLKLSEIRRSVSGLNKIKCFKLAMNQKAIDRQVELEAQLVHQAKRIILDNDWCESQFRSICPDLKADRLTLAVSQSFLNDRWDLSQIQQNTIFCIAGRTPYKGLHQAVKAMAIVRRQIPDARLIIPGDMTSKGSSWLTRSPYLLYLDKLIAQEGLQNHVIFCGRLNADQMARQMLGSNVFVMPSCIENHSSTLREAMYLGMPCISSLVGSVYELIAHNENGLVYRYDEFEDLAFHIIRVLTQPELAVKLGNRAYDTIRNRYGQAGSGEDLYQIYENMLKRSVEKGVE